MLLIIFVIWFGYKKGRDSGRNPYAWAAIAGGVFIGTQLLVGIGFGVFLAIGQQLWGWDDSVFDKYSIFVSIPAVVLSVVALLLLFRFLDRRPQTNEYVIPPPPPPTFDPPNEN